MKNNGLVSNYTKKHYKVIHTKVNEDKINNELNREFNNKRPLEVIVSDLTYVKVAGKWNYICLMIDLYNREIIGYSTGANKDAQLVKNTFDSIKENMHKITMFHTDRGHEFKNDLIENMLDKYNITRSLSHKGCSFDNAVAESTYKIIKTEFSFNREFKSLNELNLELYDYIHWYNHIRLHSSIGYRSTIEYKNM